VQALDSGDGSVLSTGKLLTIDNTIDTSTGTIQVKAVFANAENRLWPGEFVAARIRLKTLAQVVTIPARAVQRGQDGLYVFVVGSGERAQQTPVTEFQEQDGVAAIKSGLTAGMQVVVDGQSRVSNGAPLAVHQAAS
jgi:multidrug efflux system membrane fusion protein